MEQTLEEFLEMLSDLPREDVLQIWEMFCVFDETWDGCTPRQLYDGCLEYMPGQLGFDKDMIARVVLALMDLEEPPEYT